MGYDQLAAYKERMGDILSPYSFFKRIIEKEDKLKAYAESEPEDSVIIGDAKDFETLKKTWNTLGEVDPLWAVLTSPDKQGGRWDIESFYFTGMAEIEYILKEIDFLNFPLIKGKALDFGCGVGRLTQALSKHFEEVHGVDIAPSMIELAGQLAGDDGKRHYHLNQKKDLLLFTDDFFDFIYSRLVLQHMSPALSKNYISEFIRIVKPGGLIAFQLPDQLGGTGPVLADIEEYLKPSAWFVAEIEPEDQFIRLPVNESRDVKLRLKNISGESWLSVEDSGGTVQMNLGYFWLRNDGSVLQEGDGRTPIPHTLHPDEEIELSIKVKSPEFSGDFTLEIDMVQEDVTWFKHKGSKSAHIPVEVISPASLRYRDKVKNIMSRFRNKWPSHSGPQFELHGVPQFELHGVPQFELHGVPAAEVIKVIAENGGRIVAMQFNDSIGPDEPGYFYYVTK